MGSETVTRDEVIQLARTMPPEVLGKWYEFGLFLRSHPEAAATQKAETRLREEFASWEAASDEVWLRMENGLAQAE